ncbi:MAG: protein-methionine-sulfoxide reductase catalytic subunit MsrP [Gammaproteobacteria bacterium]|nr:protein-methionine-sulfoxide reductase catalytic subunit MsrP [Gammaproteobacteria bacterium]MBT8105915.1 protein-methionine-sulfoxide reductase catalytic subunit MsrP [Gammaproteobacteria bacterium]NNF49450.1 protein-methionine-sulfoxide reductase catalytic subunit MsrP [Woeseiaceae bacterium]NNK25929.1 protein-methionine-sulfoxide reductase catalytic subunit MsrP [Woeseiaceae bacterium]NNL63357.1 protein-methionine-sulfoxide reductase catalytic subunit MsrP [Woeseiaceae bacterium]
MLIRKPSDIRPSEITSRENYLNRRQFMQAGAIAGGTLLAPAALGAIVPEERRSRLPDVRESAFSTDATPNSYDDITTYNNFYEFGTGKDDPVVYARDFEPRPWTITVEGHAEKTGTFDFDDFMRPFDLEERIYRMRCVEAWSMVIPWVGISLASVVKHLQPTSRAKYVAFETLNDPTRMPGVRRRVLDWPYREGLTIAEAMNPLPILAVGLYGEVLPNQNGAPIRLVVPWKYGFKGIKSIVGIRFTEKQPPCSWNEAQPREYGFYANVNPKVAHPRWSQARERRIGAGVFASKQETLMFNGYGEHVAHLYEGLDLRRNF